MPSKSPIKANRTSEELFIHLLLIYIAKYADTLHLTHLSEASVQLWGRNFSTADEAFSDNEDRDSCSLDSLPWLALRPLLITYYIQRPGNCLCADTSRADADRPEKS